MSTPLRALWLAWGAAVALLAYPAASQTIGEQSGIMGGDSGFLRPVATGTLTIDAMPYTTMLAAGSYTLTGSASGAGAVSWSAAPSGDSGACTGTSSWSCAVTLTTVNDASQTITVSQSGGASASTSAIVWLPSLPHTLVSSQNVDGSYNSTLTDLDAVATVDNMGSSGLDLTQATGTAQPTFRTSIINGNPVIRFDGGDRVAAAAAADWRFLHNGTDFTIMVAYNTSVTGTLYAFTSTSTAYNTSTARGHVFGVDDRTGSAINDRVRFSMASGSAVNINLSSADNATSSNVWHTQTAVFDDDGGGTGDDIFMYVDNILAISGTRGGTLSSLDPSGPLTIGAATAGGSPFQGDIVAIAIWSSALTEANRAIAQEAMGALVGLAPPSGPFDATVAWFGDSLTASGRAVEEYPKKVMTAVGSGYQYYNQAKSGTQSDQIAAAVVAAQLGNVYIVTVSGGTNDIATSDFDYAAIFARLTGAYQDAAAAADIVVATTIPPMGSVHVPTKNAVNALNALIRANTDTDYVVDVWDVVNDSVDPDTIFSAYDLDGIHLTDAGNVAVATEWRAVVGL